ncbi:MAG TPA: GvpL/GvpF family gas vesicle protein [Gaiellaceae bacterium]|nr:GvpL/GvpF family gas vesicle protein [Gaiellaceae bacterium]
MSTTAEQATPEDASTTTGAYVYGVVRSGSLDGIDAEGVSGIAVEIVEGDGVAALISDLPAEELRVRRRDLHRHLGVIEEAFGKTTILPCRFGTVVDSRADVHDELLAPRRDELLSGLAQLDGRVQLNVKATYDEELLLAGIVATDPEIARLREATRTLGDAGYYERLRLGERVAEAVTAHRDADAARIVDALAPEAEDVTLEPPPPEAALKASFLVDRARLARFDTALERTAAAEQPRLRFDVIGPLPPTAFAEA